MGRAGVPRRTPPHRGHKPLRGFSGAKGGTGSVRPPARGACSLQGHRHRGHSLTGCSWCLFFLSCLCFHVKPHQFGSAHPCSILPMWAGGSEAPGHRDELPHGATKPWSSAEDAQAGGSSWHQGPAPCHRSGRFCRLHRKRSQIPVILFVGVQLIAISGRG